MMTSRHLVGQEAEVAYEKAHLTASSLLQRMEELLGDLPVPGNDHTRIGWSHVEELTYAGARIAEIVQFLEHKS